MRERLILVALLFIAACGVSQEHDCIEPESATECEVMAEVTCRKLLECIGYPYQSCVDRYDSEVCANVSGVNSYTSYTECLEGTRELNCTEAGGYPVEACDDAFIMADAGVAN